MGFTSYVADNDRRFRDALKRAALACDDLTIPFTLILKDFYRSEQAIFALKGPGQYPPFKQSTGEYWKNGRKLEYVRGDLSPYQKRKIKKYGFDYPLLVASGSLAASLLSASAPGSIAEITPGSLTFGTSIKYGVYHQSDEPRHKIPLRKFLFIGPEASQFATSDQMGRAERWLNILNDFTLKKAKESGAFQP